MNTLSATIADAGERLRGEIGTLVTTPTTSADGGLELVRALREANTAMLNHIGALHAARTAKDAQTQADALIVAADANGELADILTGLGALV